MPTVLDEIIAAKRRELPLLKEATPLAAMEQLAREAPAALNFSGALLGDQVRLIAEVKKASPSRGLLRADFDPAALARTYAENGAAAVSVLTDSHFQGALEHLRTVKEALAPLGLPILRKEFIVEPYQVYESRAAGADAILLIVAVLKLEELARLLQTATSLWMQCLVEVHTQAELETAVGAGAEVIGINNRDLATFRTDLAVTEELAPRVPQGKLVVSESGISRREELLRLGRLGVHAVLVGEALVTSSDVGAQVRTLLGRTEPAQRGAQP